MHDLLACKNKKIEASLVAKHVLRKCLKQIVYMERGKIKKLLLISQKLMAKNVPLALNKSNQKILLNNRFKYEKKCNNNRCCRTGFSQL